MNIDRRAVIRATVHRLLHDTVYEGLPEEVLDSHTFEELGLDSLDTVELIHNVESTFKVEIPDEAHEEEKLSTVGELIAFIEHHLPANRRVTQSGT